MVTVLETSRKEKATDKGFEIVRELLVDPYSERNLVLDVLLGGVFLIGGQVMRLLPARDPWYPQCWCVEAEVDHFDVLNSPANVALGVLQLFQKNGANSAKITATYRAPDVDIQSGSATVPPGSSTGQGQGQQQDAKQEMELASESEDYSASQLTLPKRYWVWATDNKPIANTDTEITIPVPKVEYQLVRHYVINKPRRAIRRLLNRVNEDPISFQTYEESEECVRFDGVHSSRKIANRGIPFWEMAYKFSVMAVFDKIEDDSIIDVGWNRFFRPDTGRWERPKVAGSAGTGRRPYLFDSGVNQVLNGSTVSGFDLLFHPLAT